ncbi:hypothetical protein J4450_02095 [Candidatus Micrarchaeota archaeon]|nr:hypothetical protein [Candidatus Micrarchaeota archaeon]
MKSGKNIYKAGKLIKIDLKYDDAILEIKIHGDFFLYPEDAIEKLQSQLIGTVIDKNAIKTRIDSILEREGIEPFGFTSEQLAEAIIGACK